jgi:hypothetical protein
MDKAFAYGGKQRENKGSINGNIYLARVLKASLFGEKGTTFVLALTPDQTERNLKSNSACHFFFGYYNLQFFFTKLFLEWIIGCKFIFTIVFDPSEFSL